MPLVVFQDGKARTSDIIKAIEYAKSHGVTILNCSWGSTEYNRALYDVIAAAPEILFVCAAGNNRLNLDETGIYPAAYDLDNILAVASVNDDGGLSGFSNYGITSVDIAAKGRDVTSTAPNNTYQTYSGTSVSAAFVSSCSGALKASNPALSGSGIKETLLAYSPRYASLDGYTAGQRVLNFETVLNGETQEEIIQNPFTEDFEMLTEADSDENWELFCANDNLQVVASGYTTLVLKMDGKIWAWGNNSSGQLGNGNTTNSITPVQVSGLSNVEKIAMSNSHCLALKTDGTVWAWGNNNEGQLGTGSLNGTVPTQVIGLNDCTDISAGYNHSMAADSGGNVWTWGNNATGQLGDGTHTSRATPIQVDSIFNISKVSAGDGFSAALSEGGTLYTWGDNQDGQLGNGSTESESVPVTVSNTYQDISAGFSHCLAITSNGQLYGWGNNDGGQLGTGNTTSVHSPQRIGTDTVSRISAGYQHSIYVTQSGSPKICGSNAFAQAGADISVDKVLTPTVISGLSHPSCISAGYFHSAALDSSGKVYTWGYNNRSQLGDGSVSHRMTPIQVSRLKQVEKISAGYYHSLALDNSGKIWTWGQNDRGQLGYTSQGVAAPTAITANATFVDADAGFYHNLAADTNGNVWAWGYNNRGQIDATLENKETPVQLTSISDVTKVSAGYMHSLALKEDGTVWSWGYNNHGQLGNGTTENSSVPVMVQGLTDIVAISAGSYHNLAVKSDGTVWAWGYNTSGQVGAGDAAECLAPIQIQTLSDIKQAEAGYYHSVALTETGDVYTWGDNSYGQLGLGEDAGEKIFAPGKVLSGITDIASVYDSVLAVSTDNTLWAWGYNNQAQLGTGNSDTLYSPTEVNAINNLRSVSSGYGHSIVIKTDGTVWAWGANSAGQLGDGKTDYRTKPYLVGGIINDIHGNTLENAHEVEDNASINAQIDYEYDEDCFKFVASTSGIYQFMSESAIDMYAYLYDASQNQLEYNDDGTDFDGNPTRDFRIEYSLTAGQTYYLKVGSNYGETGGYMLYLFPDDMPNLINSANMLTKTQQFYIGGEINHRKDIDIISFIPSATGTYIMTSVGDTGVVGEIYDSSNGLISSDSTTEGTVSFRFSADLTQGQRYYIVVKPKSPMQTGDYELNVEVPFVLQSISEKDA